MSGERPMPHGGGIFIGSVIGAAMWGALIGSWVTFGPVRTVAGAGLVLVAVAWWAVRGREPFPEPPVWVNDGGYRHVHRIGKAEQ